MSRLGELPRRGSGNRVGFFRREPPGNRDVDAVARAVGTGRFDLLLVDAADAVHADQWRAAAPALVVVPVLYRASKTEQVAAEQTYKRILKAPAKATDTLMLINDVMKGRPKARAPHAS